MYLSYMYAGPVYGEGIHRYCNGYRWCNAYIAQLATFRADDDMLLEEAKVLQHPLLPRCQVLPRLATFLAFAYPAVHSPLRLEPQSQLRSWKET